MFFLIKFFLFTTGIWNQPRKHSELLTHSQAIILFLNVVSDSFLVKAPDKFFDMLQGVSIVWVIAK